MTASGPQEPTIAYLIHRGMLIGIIVILLTATGFLAIPLFLAIGVQVTSVIEAVYDV